MVQDLQLSPVLLLWLVILYVALSLLLAVVVGRFINLGKGLDRGRVFALRPFINLNPGSSCPSRPSSSYDEEPTTL
jgi:hypothetical protein